MKNVLVILFGSLFYSAHSQEVMPLFSNAMGQPAESYPLLKPVNVDPFEFQFSAQVPRSNDIAIMAIPTINSLPSLFCKLEYKLEIKSKLAPRFRLGSLQYANWMEGKGDAFARYYK